MSRFILTRVAIVSAWMGANYGFGRIIAALEARIGQIPLPTGHDPLISYPIFAYVSWSARPMCLIRNMFAYG